ncbi:hypothetical protein [Bacillus sp. J14TS2]|uniref:hypothetical protein n=1 Tax=Bacillus sp. J14TS2 TaxID=2807188 RepID=UPI001BB398A8|nr:hypothetical protein [Bacillus sp. J14TS2]
MKQKNSAEQLWEMFEAVLDVVIAAISESGFVDSQSFKKCPEFKLKNLFTSLFLGNQLFEGA